jgi:Family of unknown function (DUF6056)
MINKLKKETNLSIKYLKIFAVFNIVLILLLSLNTFYWADDYGFIYNLKQNGILQNCINGYFNWDGRFLSLGALVQGFCLLYLPVELTTLIWSLCLLFSGFLMYYVLEFDKIFRNENKNFKHFLILFFGIVFWIGSVFHFSETVYWATGGVYILNLFLGVVWILIFLRFQDFEFNYFSKIIFLIFSFLIGGLTFNLSVALISLTIIYLIANYLKASKSKSLFNTLIFFSVVLGLAFILFAPGNYERVLAGEASKFNNFNIFILIKNYIYVLLKYTIRSSVGILISVIAALAIAFFINPSLKIPRIMVLKIPRKKEEIAEFLLDFKWLLLALSTIFPFITLPDFSARRTLVYFLYFTMLFIIGYILQFLKPSSETKSETQFLNNYLRSKSTFLIIIICSSLFVFYNLYYGFALKKVITERENILKNSRGKTIHLKLIDQDFVPACYDFVDFAEDNSPDDFVRTNHEGYFGVKIIVDKK